jgi:hypothetical protein
MQKINHRRVFVISALTALILVYAVLWTRMILDPFERTGTDFIAFYAAGRIAREYGPSEVYNLQLQKQIEERVLGFPVLLMDVAPFMHPPFIVPVLSAISTQDYQMAFHAWGILLLGIYMLSSWVFSRLFKPSKQTPILFLGSLLFFPSFISILNGQDTAILVLGGALWLFGFVKGDDRLAGLGLALATIRPHIALLLAVPFLFKRRKIFWWFFTGAGVLVVTSIALVGISGTVGFIKILAISASGEGYKINEGVMFNLIGLLHRVVPSLGPPSIRLIGWTIYLLAFLGLVLFWSKSETIDVRHIGLSVLASLLAAPHLHYHDLALLLVPIFCLLVYAENRLKLDRAVLLPLVVSTLLLLGHIPALRYLTPYLTTLGLGVVLWFFESLLTRRFFHPSFQANRK